MRFLPLTDAIEEERVSVAELADALWQAEVDRAPIAPITEGRGVAAGALFVAHRLQHGERAVGS
jgi:hypothetical protein